MVFYLEPNPDLTGGSWYSVDQQGASFMDMEFIKEMSSLICKFISTRRGVLATIDDILQHLRPFTRIPVGESEAQLLVDRLIYEGKVDRIEDGYRITKQVYASNGLTEAPCGTCPVFKLCCDGGPVSPQNCVYLPKWLGY